MLNANLHRIKEGEKLNLAKFDASATKAFSGDKKDALKELAKLKARLEALQELLYAEGKHKVLIVFQAMDAGGKDGTIRSVFDGVNPQGVRVAAFKAPTPEELAHDYLWRIHQQTPGKGEIVIFNRSHYEDVLVVRVHNIVPEAVWSKRYAQIRHFEHLLADEGALILKFYLHIDLDEQKQRLQERLDDPIKRWKLSRSDLAERKLWPQYMAAFAEAIEKTSTEVAPWYVVPANHNWYRNWVVMQIIVAALEGLAMKYPTKPAGLDNVIIE